MTVDERARAGLFLAMQYPVEVPGVSVVELPAHRQDRHRRRGAQAAHLGQGRQRRAGAAQPRPDVRAALGQRGLLRRREEAPRDRPARAAQPEGRGPRRDRLRPRHRRAQDRLRGRQPVPRPGGQGRPADHPLHPHPALHQARLRARLRRRPDRRAGRPRAGRPARGRGLRQVRQGRGGLTMTARVERDRGPASRAGRRSARTSRSSSRTLAGGQPLVYLDSANTSQKPQVVIDTMVDHLERHNANIARAMHQLGAESTEAFEAARDKVAAFIGAPDRDEVIFTKNASEALNLVANTLAWADGDAAGRRRATRSSSPRWSTTPTSCRGSCSPSAPARRCAGSGSPTTAGSTCRTSTS